jgi:hypothetical protein
MAWTPYPLFDHLPTPAMALTLPPRLEKEVTLIEGGMRLLLTDFELHDTPALHATRIKAIQGRFAPHALMHDGNPGNWHEDGGHRVLDDRRLFRQDAATIYAFDATEHAFFINFFLGTQLEVLLHVRDDRLGGCFDATNIRPERYHTTLHAKLPEGQAGLKDPKGYEILWNWEAAENRRIFNSGARAVIHLDPYKSRIVMTRHDLLHRVHDAQGEVKPGVRLLFFRRAYLSGQVSLLLPGDINERVPRFADGDVRQRINDPQGLKDTYSPYVTAAPGERRFAWLRDKSDDANPPILFLYDWVVDLVDLWKAHDLLFKVNPVIVTAWEVYQKAHNLPVAAVEAFVKFMKALRYLVYKDTLKYDYPGCHSDDAPAITLHRLRLRVNVRPKRVGHNDPNDFDEHWAALREPASNRALLFPVAAHPSLVENAPAPSPLKRKHGDKGLHLVEEEEEEEEENGSSSDPPSSPQKKHRPNKAPRAEYTAVHPPPADDMDLVAMQRDEIAGEDAIVESAPHVSSDEEEEESSPYHAALPLPKADAPARLEESTEAVQRNVAMILVKLQEHAEYAREFDDKREPAPAPPPSTWLPLGERLTRELAQNQEYLLQPQQIRLFSRELEGERAAHIRDVRFPLLSHAQTGGVDAERRWCGRSLWTWLRRGGLQPAARVCRDVRGDACARYQELRNTSG